MGDRGKSIRLFGLSDWTGELTDHGARPSDLFSRLDLSLHLRIVDRLERHLYLQIWGELAIGLSSNVTSLLRARSS